MAYLIEARFGDEEDRRNVVQAVALDGLSDATLRKLFVPAGADLVSESFVPEDRVDELLGLVFDAVTGHPLWRSDGRKALQAVVEGCASSEGAQAWARFIEGAAHHLYDMCEAPPADNLGARNLAAQVEEQLKGAEGAKGQPKASNIEKTRRLMMAIAEARGDWLREAAQHRVLRQHLARRARLPRLSTIVRGRERVRGLLASLARSLRNHDAHGGRAVLSHRARAEAVEACVVLLLSIAMRYRSKLAAQVAWAQVPIPSAPGSAGLNWLVEGQSQPLAHQDLVEVVLGDLNAHCGSIIRGERGVGLSSLARHIMAGAYRKGLYLVPSLERSRLEDALADTEALRWLLGDDWPSPWLKYLLSTGKVGVILDGLGLLQAEELERAVSLVERVLVSCPTLKVVVLQPYVLPADEDTDREWPILGNLNKAPRILVLGRCLPEAAEGPYLAWWLDRRHLAPGERVGGFDFIWKVSLASVAFDHPSLWVELDVSRTLRPAYQWLGLGILCKLTDEFDEASKDAVALRVPQGALSIAFRRCLHSLAGITLTHDVVAPDDLLRGLEIASLVVREDNTWCWLAQPTLQEAASQSAWWDRVVFGWNALRAQDRAALLSGLGLDDRPNLDDLEGAL